jgi:hypothetical protein
VEVVVALPAAIPPALKVEGMAERTSVSEGLVEVAVMEVDEVDGFGRLCGRKGFAHELETEIVQPMAV